MVFLSQLHWRLILWSFTLASYGIFGFMTFIERQETELQVQSESSPALSIWCQYVLQWCIISPYVFIHLSCPSVAKTTNKDHSHPEPFFKRFLLIPGGTACRPAGCFPLGVDNTPGAAGDCGAAALVGCASFLSRLDFGSWHRSRASKYAMVWLRSWNRICTTFTVHWDSFFGAPCAWVMPRNSAVIIVSSAWEKPG